MDKTDAVFWALRAELLFSLAKRKEALDSLYKAQIDAEFEDCELYEAWRKIREEA